MSTYFGEIRQVGYVVRDIRAAMRDWIETFGVGPWYFSEKVMFRTFRYKGTPYPIEIALAMANSGGLQIELIQQLNDVPSMYVDFLERNGPGLQHVSSWPDDYGGVRSRALARGLKIAQDGESERGAFVYFDNEFHPGTVMELSEQTETRRRVFDTIRQAAVGWSGDRPIRSMSEIKLD